jgi:hypothetical protein
MLRWSGAEDVAQQNSLRAEKQHRKYVQFRTRFRRREGRASIAETGCAETCVAAMVRTAAGAVSWPCAPE